MGRSAMQVSKETAGRQRGAGEFTRDQIVENAKSLVPVLRERAQAAAKARRIPQETVDDFYRLGLLQLGQPRRYGGFEFGWDLLCEISQILAAADGAQAWIHRILADHAVMMATFPEEAQKEVWANDPTTLISSSFDPAGRARRVQDGFIFSGRHKFASGIDVAEWLICGGFIQDGEKLDGPHFFLIPKANVTVIDDWDTLGLEATGSKSFEVNDLFIPAHRFLDGELARTGRGPGTLINKAPVYRTPRGGLTSTGFSAISVGIARGVLDEWLHFASRRKLRVDQSGNWQVAAICSAEIDAAEALYFSTITKNVRKLEIGESLSDFDLLMARRNVAYASRLAIEAGSKIFAAAGAHALFNHQRINQQYRNLLASGGHFTVSWDAHGPAFGRLLLETSAT